MQQLKNLNAPALVKIFAKWLSNCIVRRANGEIFFAPAMSRNSLIYPAMVEKDKIVFDSKRGKRIRPSELLDVIHPTDLRIEEIVWL